MPYIIEATYTTGDSNGDERTSTELSPIWHDLVRAKEALKWLDEHHKYYQKLHDRWPPENLKNFDTSNIKDQPWYIEISKFSDWEFSLNVLLDDGSPMIVRVPYHGYFETLHSLDIIVVEPDTSDMSINY